MSKAFTKEDDASGLPELPRLHSPLKPGERNYLTEAGARRLRRELEQLSGERRPPLAAAAPADGEARRELQLLDQRIAYLEESLRTAVVVTPDATTDDRVRFGATVTVRNGAGEETVYRLVGVDETDLEKNWVSWQCPIARALLNRRVGEKVVFRFPAGQTELEIEAIGYERALQGATAEGESERPRPVSPDPTIRGSATPSPSGYPNLYRFLFAQSGLVGPELSDYPRALREIQNGRKETHWIWYVFPQVQGLGLSEMSVRYGIASIEEARAYLGHPILSERLRECVAAMKRHKGTAPEAILGPIDAAKYRSCLTLFKAVAGPDSVFAEALNDFYAGKEDDKTIALLATLGSGAPG